MNVLLLASIIFSMAPGHRGQEGFYSGNSMSSDSASSNIESVPCLERRDDDAYQIFAQRHIVRKMFGRTSKDEWKTYLSEAGLCGRVEVQSFIEAKYENDVKQICSHSGRRLKDKSLPGNLCISSSQFSIYNVKSTNRNGCRVTDVKMVKQSVVVACNKVKNICLPVHFEKYDEQQPDNKACQ